VAIRPSRAYVITGRGEAMRRGIIQSAALNPWCTSSEARSAHVLLPPAGDADCENMELYYDELDDPYRLPYWLVHVELEADEGGFIMSSILIAFFVHELHERPLMPIIEKAAQNVEWEAIAEFYGPRLVVAKLIQ
jgi:hypothetical protein